MAIITKVSAQKRQGRYNIFLDQEYAFSVSEKTLAEFVLLKGQELSPQKINEILDYEASAKASDLAARYLSYQPRTVKEVTDYLSQHEISRSAAKRAVNELTQQLFNPGSAQIPAQQGISNRVNERQEVGFRIGELLGNCGGLGHRCSLSLQILGFSAREWLL